MGVVINPFDDAGFDLATMSKGISILPNNYGRLNELGLFAHDPITTRTLIVEEERGILTLLKSQPVGAPAVKAGRGERKQRSFVVPHIPLEDRILAEEYAGVRQFGTDNAATTLNSVMVKHTQAMKNSFAITLEHLRMGAVKGHILDGDGTELYSLFTEFGITEKIIDFALDVDTTDVAAKCRELLRHIEDNLLGEVMSGVHCLCSQEFFDALIAHPEVEKFYLNHQEAMNLTGNGADPRKGFRFGGIVFEEYRATATDSTGATRRFIAAGEAHFFPTGTMDSFKTAFAPASFIETVNTPGLELYAKQSIDAKYARWVDLYAESNPLPICRRPGLLVKGTI